MARATSIQEAALVFGALQATQRKLPLRDAGAEKMPRHTRGALQHELDHSVHALNSLRVQKPKRRQLGQELPDPLAQCTALRSLRQFIAEQAFELACRRLVDVCVGMLKQLRGALLPVRAGLAWRRQHEPEQQQRVHPASNQNPPEE
eukprot:2059581-Alexandrium_andersonii.AAC.2